jgi:hypothetical protein
MPAEWQWSAEIPDVISSETGGPPRAFLWIPPTCRAVRAVVVGQHNFQEETILEHPEIRATLADLNFAAVWISPPLDLGFDDDATAGPRLEAVLANLGRASGYDELAFAPLVPLGHSAAASYPWNYAAWNPRRTLAVLSISGQWPFGSDDAASTRVDDSLDGIPGLVTLGEYEWANDRAAAGLLQRNANPRLPLTFLGEAAGGHFELSPAKAAYLALYLRKAAAYRLPPETGVPYPAPVALTPMDARVTGWLVDRWRGDEPARVPAAPVEEYAEPEEAFWCFDEEHAVKTEKFRLADRGKRVALLGFVQNGAVLPHAAGTHPQVTIPFLPLPDGITFQLGATFLNTVPTGRPERWTGLPAGASIRAPSTRADITIERLCGPVVRTGPDTFAVRFNRTGLRNLRRTGEIWLAATHPGDAQFKGAVQQALLRIPLRNESGAPQRLTFPAPSDQPVGTKTLQLTATSDAGVPVQYYVREGPATIEGDTLTFTPLPPRARLPIPITIVAWQYGRTAAPPLQSAAPVERTIHLVRG